MLSLGVGFDGRGTYSAESRKMSIIQRTCARKISFAGHQVPDNMNAFGIYDYSVKSETFSSIDAYIQRLNSKAATSSSRSNFAMERSKFETATSVQLGPIGGLSAGHGSGNSFSSDSEQGQSSLNSRQRQRTATRQKNHFLAVLTAEMELYEIALDAITPDNLADFFLNDFLKLPSSYYSIGADYMFQSFILRYGTHVVKSGKFGGQLKIMKKSTSDSSMSSDEFAVQAEREFKSMTSTLQSSYSQSEGGFSSFLGGFKSSRASQRERASGSLVESKQEAGLSGGTQSNSRSEFMQTDLEVTGGNPKIAAAIMDFYKPSFRTDFITWLTSISDYAKPYEFTLSKISKVLDVNIDSLFSDQDLKQGCFSDDAIFDKSKNMYYFNQTRRDNGIVIGVERHYCKFGKSKEKFVEDFQSKRLSLERAENVYMTEGPFSRSSFEIEGGNPGCESDVLDYQGKEDNKLWPSWESMKKDIFKVVFKLPFDLPNLKSDTELLVRLHEDSWFYKLPGGTFDLPFTCPTLTDYDTDKVFCAAGLQLKYHENNGFFSISANGNNHSDLMSVGTGRYVGRLLEDELEYPGQEHHTIGSLHNVPCNLKWSNGLRLDPQNDKTCIHFTAASSGNIYVVFAGSPREHHTWFYLKLAQGKIQFYQGMILKMDSTKDGIGTLGDENLYESFFVCINQGNGNLKIMYGKAAASKEIGEVRASYVFPETQQNRLSFYTFGSGESRIQVHDVRVINSYPAEIKCSPGYVKVDGDCVLHCHEECDGCHKPLDDKACVKCKKYQINLPEGIFQCTSKCPAAMEPFEIEKRCKYCDAGTMRAEEGNQECTKCPKGTFQVHKGRESCDKCRQGYFSAGLGKIICTKCPVGTFTDNEGSEVCSDCPSGTFQDEESMTSCKPCGVGTYSNGTKNRECRGCEPGTYNNQEGQGKCKACEEGKFQKESGQSHCKLCHEGEYSAKTRAIVCSKCRKNTYNNKTGGKSENSCIPCKGGLTSPAGSVSCNNPCGPGTYLRKGEKSLRV